MARTVTVQTSDEFKPAGKIRVTAVHAGIATGLLAVLAGTLFEVRPPEAYGVCMTCHARDLVNWSINMLARTHLPLAPASLLFPTLTTVGVIVGALVGAKTSREFRWISPENPWKTLVYGALVMNLALLAGGCSIRLMLRATSGEVLGMIGFSGMIAGMMLGTWWLRWRATR